MPEPDYQNDLVFPPEEKQRALQEKLEIAVRALKKIEILIALNLVDRSKISTAYKLSHQALEKIKEIKECEARK